MGTQDLVTLVPWTFIAQICNLFIQMWLIKKFLFKPINDILEKRKKLADKTIREAREAQDKADSLKEQYESSLTKAHAEAAEIVSEAQKEAQKKADTIVQEAQEEGAELLQPTKDEVTYSDGTTETVNGFDVPVPAIDEEFDLAIIGTKGKWYDHKVSVSDVQPAE